MKKKLIFFFLFLFIGSFILESCVTVVHKSRPRRRKRPVKKIIIIKPRKK